MTRRRQKFDGGGDNGGGTLEARVSQRLNAKGQRQGKKEEEEEEEEEGRPLNRFITVKTWPTRPA
jgi:hypothetical protein